jgi:hypothetical protein
MKCSCGKEIKNMKEYRKHVEINSMFKGSIGSHVLDENDLETRKMVLAAKDNSKYTYMKGKRRF